MRLMPRLRRWVPVLLFLLLVGWAIYYITKHPTELAAIGNLSAGWLLLLFCLATLKVVSLGLFTKVIVATFDIDLGFTEWFGLSAASMMGNYLTPFRGGAAVRAVYLKSAYKLSYSRFLSTLAALYVLTFATSAALGLLSISALYFRFGHVDATLTLFFILCLSLPVVLFYLAKPTNRLVLGLGNQVDSKRPSDLSFVSRLLLRGLDLVGRVTEGWQIISARRGTLAKLTVVSFANASVTLLMIHFSFVAFAVQLPLLESLVLSSLFMISSLIPVTPSGLGVAEAAVVMASHGFGVDGSVGVLSTGLNRGVLILTSLIWGAVFTYALGQRVVPSSKAQ